MIRRLRVDLVSQRSDPLDLIALDGITAQLLEFGMNKQKVILKDILLQPHVITQRMCMVFIDGDRWPSVPLRSSARD